MTPIVAWLAGGIVAVHLATANLWGYHRDEFYYLACGRRLAWGFVDHPPLTPALYRLADLTVGTSKVGLRVMPALLHGLTVVLVALLARELGGTPRAQLLAALATVLAPILLTTGHFLGTVTPELAIGAGLAIVLVRIAHGGDPRLWMLAGLVAGIGLTNKWTLGFVLVGLLVGMFVGNRDALATPWLLAGCAVAAAVVAPVIWWQAAHGWPQLEFARTLRNYGDAPGIIPLQLVLLGAAAILAVPGVHWLVATDAGRPHRFLAIAFGVAVVAVMATGGKPYYTAAALPGLIAAGAVALQGTTGAALPGAIVAVGVLLAPLAMPLTPQSTASALRAVNPELGEMIGWEALAARLEVLHREHPNAGIVTQNYSEAGSIELLAPALPQPASGHNSYWDWGPPLGDPDEVIALGTDRGPLERAFGSVRRIGTVHSPGGLGNMEHGTPIWLATGRRAPWSELWPGFRRV